jgi:type VI protein secretion system component VasK
MDFWETVWLLFTGFALVAYLIVVFAVIRGVLHDDMPGWAKAAWLVALIFVPFLTAIVYVIVRGTAGDLTWGDGGQAQAHQAQYERSVAPQSPTQEIARAKSMWDSGVIDHAEFDALKLKALS